MDDPAQPRSEFSAPLKALLQRSATTCSMTLDQWDTLAEEFGEEVYTEALYRLSRLEMPAKEARECLEDIVRHQQSLCDALNRNVSLLTAMCDYFMYVKPVVREPVLVEVRLLQQKEESAYKDELTGLFNRRYFNQELPREMERFRRFGQPFTLLMLDLDHFKDFNDAYGHSAGDHALREISRLLGETARLYDRVVRYGGEEFAIILPQASGEEAQGVAERIREALAQHRIVFAGQDLGPITVSIGLATYPKDGLDMCSLVQRADRALYQAKETRNCIRCYRDTQRASPRYALSDPLPLRIRSGIAGDVFGSALDISFGGLRCASTTPLPPDEKLHLVISDAAQTTRLALQAQVRRVSVDAHNTFHLGLSFQLPSVEDQKTLMALIEGHMQGGSFEPLGCSARPLPYS